MTNEERIKINAEKGFQLVAAFDGWEIYKKLNEVGAYTYYSDQIGNEGAYPIWNTAINSQEELITLYNDILQNGNPEQQPHKITFWPNGQLSARDLAGNTVDSLQAKGWMELYFEYLEQQGIDPATIQFEAMYGDHWMIIEPFKTNYGWNVNLKKQE